MRELLVNIELVYFIYVRKSTDVEDKQILSVAAQIIELKEFAKRMGLRIAGIIVEKQTAKKPGRPKFNKMLERIENGGANGVLAWLPDRLSRNSIDSGRVIYMLDENIIADLKFPHFWFENTPQGKYMLANEFNSSKQYVDNLSVNTKRGLRQKVREGHCLRLAPVGYINDVRTKTIWVDKKMAEIVRQAFELYATGTKTLDDIAAFLYANGVKTRGRRRKRASQSRQAANSGTLRALNVCWQTCFIMGISGTTAWCMRASIRGLSTKRYLIGCSASLQGADAPKSKPPRRSRLICWSSARIATVS